MRMLGELRCPVMTVGAAARVEAGTFRVVDTGGGVPAEQVVVRVCWEPENGVFEMEVEFE